MEEASSNRSFNRIHILITFISVFNGRWNADYLVFRGLMNTRVLNKPLEGIRRKPKYCPCSFLKQTKYSTFFTSSPLSIYFGTVRLLHITFFDDACPEKTQNCKKPLMACWCLLTLMAVTSNEDPLLQEFQRRQSSSESSASSSQWGNTGVK